MLKTIDPLLSADLLWILAAMGHGDDLAVVDDNHPAERIARATVSGRLIRMPGVLLPQALKAILTLLPIDDFEPDPIRTMAPVDKRMAQPEVQREVQRLITAKVGRGTKLANLEREAFYQAGERAFGIVQVGDSRPYGCFLLRKGVIN